MVEIKMGDMVVKILCHTCLGRGYVEETDWETKATVSVECPECEGEGYVLAKRWESPTAVT